MALIILSLTLPLISSLPTSLSDTLTKCPRITCSEPLGDDVCFLHSSDNPVSWIKLQNCPPGKLCPSPLASFTTHAQSILASNDPLKSPTFQRLTKATCESTYNRNLLPGRKCTSNYQCQSFVCEEQKCKGYSSGASCYKHEQCDINVYRHEQCDIGLACISKGAFPYATTCDSLRKIGDQCEEDVECQQTSVCWYQTRGDFYQMKYGLSDNQTFGWAPKHYDTYQDVLYNGRLCQSGFAVPYYDSNDTRPLGICTTFSSVYTDQGNFTMSEAAQCMVTNLASYCQYHYRAPTGIEDVVKIRCACPADGSIGYCPLPSIDAMRKYSLYDYALSGNGTNCHTLDRNSIASVHLSIPHNREYSIIIQIKSFKQRSICLKIQNSLNLTVASAFPHHSQRPIQMLKFLQNSGHSLKMKELGNVLRIKGQRAIRGQCWQASQLVEPSGSRWVW